MTCELCEHNTGRHDFNLACCRARYLAALPSRDLRLLWLARWRDQRLPEEFINDIKAHLRARAEGKGSDPGRIP